MKESKLNALFFTTYKFKPLCLFLVLIFSCISLQVAADPVKKLNNKQILEFTAIEALQAMAQGRLTSLEYVDILLARAGEYAHLNAYIHLDPRQVRQDAMERDQERANGVIRGPLHGLPILIKDNLDTADIPTTGGTRGLIGFQPATNAAVVQTLLDAGALVLGKSNLHELTIGITTNNGVFGPARNPYDPSRISGGSSGGNGVALASGMAPLAIGSDTGGSIRIPAALTGTIGFRPSTGRYSTAGAIPISMTLDTVGPMGRSVEDMMLIDSLFAASPTPYQELEPSDVRIGVPRPFFYDDIHPDIADGLEKTIKKLRQAGVTVVEMEIAGIKETMDAISFNIVGYEWVIQMNNYLSTHNTGLDIHGLVAQVDHPEVKAILESNLDPGIPEAAYRAAMDIHRPALMLAFRQAFAEHNIQAILIPTTPLPAAEIGEDDTVELNGKQEPTIVVYSRYSNPGAVAGLPGLALPIGLTKEKLPIGLELDGPAGTDEQLLAVGKAIEKILKPISPPKR